MIVVVSPVCLDCRQAEVFCILSVEQIDEHREMALNQDKISANRFYTLRRIEIRDTVCAY